MYEEIIDLPRHQSSRHRHMTPDQRAVQFAPFAALSGFKELMEETFRTTEERRELSDDRKEEIGRQLAIITGRNAEIRYFVPDDRKEGGEYRVICGPVRKISVQDRVLTMENGTVIPFDDISEIEEIGMEE